jgi:hypothetical protein
MRIKLICHSYASTVRADPGGTITDSPEIFLKAGITDLEAARAIMTIRHLFLASVTLETLLFSAGPFHSFLICHLA